MKIINNFLAFTYAENPGIAFGGFQGAGDWGRWILVGLAGAAAVGVFYYFWRTPRDNDRTLGACALLFAGIWGNLMDRVRLGYVIDQIAPDASKEQRTCAERSIIIARRAPEVIEDTDGGRSRESD